MAGLKVALRRRRFSEIRKDEDADRTGSAARIAAPLGYSPEKL
jgi:hypothetical protein